MVPYMATWDDVHRLATGLPRTVEGASREGRLDWSVQGKTFAWERPLRRGDLEALGDTAPEGPILAARVPDLGAKEALLADEECGLLLGDYNVIPEPKDCWNPAAWARDALFLPETRAAFRRVAHLGFTDALRAVDQGPGLYTFWDYTAGCWQRDLGFRLDHLLCSPEATDGLRGAGVDRWARGEEKASDHAPTWVELA